MQQLELKLFGCGVDIGHSCEVAGGRPRSSLGNRRQHVGLAVLDRLDNLESNVDNVSRVANKAKVQCSIQHPNLCADICSMLLL